MEDITITESAAKRVKELLTTGEYASVPIEGLRVFVRGGGCNGFNYGFDFVSDIEDDDLVFEKDGVKFIVDPMSIMYLIGSTVDYKSEPFQQYFTINNPNVATTCGCGSSFAV